MPTPVVGQEADFACERAREALESLKDMAKPVGKRKGDALQLLSQARSAVGRAEAIPQNTQVLLALAGVTR